MCGRDRFPVHMWCLCIGGTAGPGRPPAPGLPVVTTQGCVCILLRLRQLDRISLVGEEQCLFFLPYMPGVLVVQACAATAHVLSADTDMTIRMGDCGGSVGRGGDGSGELHVRVAWTIDALLPTPEMFEVQFGFRCVSLCRSMSFIYNHIAITSLATSRNSVCASSEPGMHILVHAH